MNKKALLTREPDGGQWNCITVVDSASTDTAMRDVVRDIVFHELNRGQLLCLRDVADGESGLEHEEADTSPIPLDEAVPLRPTDSRGEHRRWCNNCKSNQYATPTVDDEGDAIWICNNCNTMMRLMHPGEIHDYQEKDFKKGEVEQFPLYRCTDCGKVDVADYVNDGVVCITCGSRNIKEEKDAQRR